MIADDEIRTIFRSIMGRDIFDVSYFKSKCASAADVRRELFGSKEFIRRLTETSDEFTRARQISSRELAAEIRDHLFHGVPCADLTLEPGATPPYLPGPLAEFCESLLPRVVVVVGPAREGVRWLLRHLFPDAKAGEVVSVICLDPEIYSRNFAVAERDPLDLALKSHCRAPCLLKAGDIELSVLFMSVDLPICLKIFSGLGIFPDLFFVSSASEAEAPSLLEAAFDYLSDRGGLVVHPAVGQAHLYGCLERFAQAIYRDSVRVNKTLIVQRHEWHFTRNTLRVSKPRSNFDAQSLKDKLALAFIVKDEADIVANMLASVAPIVGFVACLDTGSTDDSVAQIRSFVESENIPHKIETCAFTRFDEMRNRAIDLVPAGFEWVLMLDADELLMPEDFPKLKALLSQSQHDAWALPRFNWLDADRKEHSTIYPDRQGRLFKRNVNPPIRYDGAVHEHLVGFRSLGTGPIGVWTEGEASSGLHIHHMSIVLNRNTDKKTDLYRRLGG